MKYIVSINDKNFEVEVEKGQATIIKTEEKVIPAAQVAAPPASEVVSQAVKAPSNVEGEKVLAPMPGVILNVKAHLGSTVKKGDALLVFEAMKMENEVVSPRGGVIAFMVSKGTHVSTGDVIVVIK